MTLVHVPAQELAHYCCAIKFKLGRAGPGPVPLALAPAGRCLCCPRQHCRNCRYRQCALRLHPWWARC